MTNYTIPQYKFQRYSRPEIEAALRSAGFPVTSIKIMAAIAFAESSWSNVVQQNQPYKTTGWGTWQITPGNSVPSVGVDKELLDINVNARAAHVKYISQGLRAWSTYNNGVYTRYMHYNDNSGNTLTTQAVAHPVGVGKTLARGNTGSLVGELQRVLSMWYPWLGLKIDSLYGPATEAAVKEFQQRAGLAVTGVADGSTLKGLGILSA